MNIYNRKLLCYSLTHSKYFYKLLILACINYNLYTIKNNNDKLDNLYDKSFNYSQHVKIYFTNRILIIIN